MYGKADSVGWGFLSAWTFSNPDHLPFPELGI